MIAHEIGEAAKRPRSVEVRLGRPHENAGLKVGATKLWEVAAAPRASALFLCKTLG
jgi:hypothetical protein